MHLDSYRRVRLYLVLAPLLLAALLTPATTTALPRSEPAPLAAFPEQPIAALFSTGDKLFFVSGSLRYSLWRSDGTDQSNTLLVANMAWVGALTALGDQLLFVGSDDAHGYELWTSDGTAAGTHILLDINPGAAGSEPSHLTVAGNRLFFSANNGASGKELWASDGTAAGTHMLRDIVPGPANGISAYSELVALGSTIYFTAGDDAAPQYGTTVYNNFQLWKSDGTSAGTVLLKDRVRPAALNMAASEATFGALAPPPIAAMRRLVPFGSGVIFTVEEELGHYELWKSDGTAGGAALLKPGVQGCSYQPWQSAALNGQLLFCASVEPYHYSLWRSDGTGEGTYPLIPDILLDTSLAVMDGALFVKTNSTIWRTDGTPAGTRPLLTVTQGSVTGSLLGRLAVIGHTLFFTTEHYNTAAALPKVSTALWKSDGTVVGTIPVRSFSPEAATLLPIQVAGLPLLLHTVQPDGRETLWSSDGGSGGTRPIGDLGSNWWQQTAVYQGQLAVAVHAEHGDLIRLFPGPAAAFVSAPAVIGAPPGGSASVPVTYGTNGAAASGVQVSLTLPPGVSYLHDSSGVAPSVVGNTLTWALPDLAALEVRTLQVRLGVPDSPLGTRYSLTASTRLDQAAPASAAAEIKVADQVFLPRAPIAP